MPTYIALLRAINVSGKNKIRMPDLKAMFEDAGFREVSTYIQSGNVIFKAGKPSSRELETQIESLLQKTFQLPIHVMVRTQAELQKIRDNNPFLQNSTVDPEKLHVGFIQSKPSATVLQSLQEMKNKEDEFVIRSKEIYVYCPGGYGKTKFSNSFFETKLKLPVTTRNWKTLETLAGNN